MGRDCRGYERGAGGLQFPGLPVVGDGLRVFLAKLDELAGVGLEGLPGFGDNEREGVCIAVEVFDEG